MYCKLKVSSPNNPAFTGVSIDLHVTFPEWRPIWISSRTRKDDVSFPRNKKRHFHMVHFYLQLQGSAGQCFLIVVVAVTKLVFWANLWNKWLINHEGRSLRSLWRPFDLGNHLRPDRGRWFSDHNYNIIKPIRLQQGHWGFSPLVVIYIFGDLVLPWASLSVSILHLLASSATFFAAGKRGRFAIRNISPLFLPSFLAFNSERKKKISRRDIITIWQPEKKKGVRNCVDDRFCSSDHFFPACSKRGQEKSRRRFFSSFSANIKKEKKAE